MSAAQLTPLAAWRQPACQKFHSRAASIPGQACAIGFVPNGEPDDEHAACSYVLTNRSDRGVHRARRVLTWEDTLPRLSCKVHREVAPSNVTGQCMPFTAIGTATRPVEAWWTGGCRDAAQGAQRARPCGMALLIEKAASATLGEMLERRGASGGHCNQTRCVSGAKRAGACDRCLAGTFAPARADLAFAFVRDPLDRFLSTAAHALHRPLLDLDGAAHPEIVISLQSIVEAVVHGEGRWDPRFFTQSYSLAATDAAGSPIDWGYIGRLEGRGLATGLAHVARRLDEPLAQRWRWRMVERRRRNVGEVHGHVRAALRRALLADRKMACGFCEVHAQDYACTGYEPPEECAECRGWKEEL